MATEIVITHRQDDDGSLGDMSSLVSPTTMWMQGNTMPVAAFPQKVSIHTGGVDLKTLLSQGGNDNTNNSNDYIFTDDESGSSPAASRIEEEEDLLSPISSTSILGVEPPFSEEPSLPPKPSATKEDVTLSSTKDWSVHNQQRGREVAKHVLQKVRSKKSPEAMSAATKPTLRYSTSADTYNSDDVEQQLQDNRRSAPSPTKTSKGPRRNILHRCMNRLRRQRRNFLDKVFHSNAPAKISESPTAAQTSATESTVAQVPSNRSTGSLDSLKSSPHIYDDVDSEEWNYGEEKSVDEESIYIEEVGKGERQERGKDKKATEQDDPTPKRSNVNPNNKDTTWSGRKKMLRPKSVVTNFSMDDKKQIHRTSQVVDSILRQFVDDNAKNGGTPSSTEIKKPIGSVLLARRESGNGNSKSILQRNRTIEESEKVKVGKSSPSVLQRQNDQEDSPKVGKGNMASEGNETRMATSRVRNLADAAEEIRKLGPEGELYLARQLEMLRAQEANGSKRKLDQRDTNRDQPPVNSDFGKENEPVELNHIGRGRTLGDKHGTNMGTESMRFRATLQPRQ